jgi:hypothetical protein
VNFKKILPLGLAVAALLGTSDMDTSLISVEAATLSSSVKTLPKEPGVDPLVLTPGKDSGIEIAGHSSHSSHASHASHSSHSSGSGGGYYSPPSYNPPSYRSPSYSSPSYSSPSYNPPSSSSPSYSSPLSTPSSSDIRPSRPSKLEPSATKPIIPSSILSLTAQEYYQLGNKAYDREDYIEAVANYSEAIKLKSNFPYAILNRGNSYMLRGDNQNALKDYTALISLNPNFARAYFNMGVLYQQSGEYSSALSNYQKAVKLFQLQSDTEMYQKTQDLITQVKSLNP